MEELVFWIRGSGTDLDGGQPNDILSLRTPKSYILPHQNSGVDFQESSVDADCKKWIQQRNVFIIEGWPIANDKDRYATHLTLPLANLSSLLVGREFDMATNHLVFELHIPVCSDIPVFWNELQP